jgi:Rieske Fe-S protein
MRSNRREFVRALSVLSCCAMSGCQQEESLQSLHKREVSIGPLAAIPQGLSTRVLERVAIVRERDSLKFFSLVCTHQQCLLHPQQQSLICPCHGAQFRLDGTVARGPAVLPLPQYSYSVSDEGEVVVDLSSSM